MSVLRATDAIIKKAAEGYFQLGAFVPSPLDRENPGKKEPYEKLGKALYSDRKKFSSKLDSLLIYFSRIVRPLWGKCLGNIYAYKCLAYERLEAFNQEELNVVRRKVNELKTFLKSQTDKLLTKTLEKNEFKNDISEKPRFDTQNTYPPFRDDPHGIFSTKKPPTPIFPEELSRVNTTRNSGDEIVWEEQVNYFYRCNIYHHHCSPLDKNHVY